MAAGLGFKTFVSGEVLTAADTNGYLMQGILVFASASARNAAITSPQEGQYCYLKDTNSTEYYDGAAWVSGVEGDISGVTAGTGISGGGTSGTVTVTNSMATTITTKGDLVPGTGSGTFSRLAVGNNGESIYADSAATTGLRYNPINTLSNPLINSALDIAQRGTTFTTVGTIAYTLDRWVARTSSAGGSFVTTQQLTSDTTNLPNIQYCARNRRTTSNTDTGTLEFSQAMENSNSTPFIGKTVTLSFYARKSANLTGSFIGVLYSGTGTNEQVPVTFTGSTAVGVASPTLTTTWTRYVTSGTIATSATQIGVMFRHTPTGTAGADDYYEVTGAQIHLGTYTASTAPTFSRNGATIQGETSACQRYYFRQSASATAPYLAMGATVWASGATTGDSTLTLPVTMRVAPTSIDYSTLGIRIGVGTIFAVTALGLQTVLNGANTAKMDVTVASGLTSNTTYYLIGNNSASAYLGFSAEL